MRDVPGASPSPEGESRVGGALSRIANRESCTVSSPSTIHHPPSFLSEPSRGLRDLGGSLTVTAGWMFVTIVGLFLKPDPHGHGTHQRLGMPPCPSVLLFDRPCPGCGLTTSWTALLHGDLALAFRAHALGPILYLGLTAFAFGTLVLALRGRRWRDGPWVTPVLAGAFGVFLAYGLVRMALTPHYATTRERLLSVGASL